jgi:hypothetical protein
LKQTVIFYPYAGKINRSTTPGAGTNGELKAPTISATPSKVTAPATLRAPCKVAKADTTSAPVIPTAPVKAIVGEVMVAIVALRVITLGSTGLPKLIFSAPKVKEVREVIVNGIVELR